MEDRIESNGMIVVEKDRQSDSKRKRIAVSPFVWRLYYPMSDQSDGKLDRRNVSRIRFLTQIKSGGEMLSA